MKKQLNKMWDDIYIYSVILYIFATIITSIFVYANTIVKFPFTIIRYSTLAICVVKLFFHDIHFYKPKSIPVVFCLFCFFLINSITAGNRTLFQLFLLILGAYHVDFKKIAQKVCFWESLFLFLIIFASVVGIIPNREFGRTGEEVIRYSLGFKYSTYSSLLIWSMTTLYLYCRKDKLKILEYIVLIFVNLVIYLLTDSRNELLCSFLVIAAFFFHQHGLLKHINKLVPFIAKYSMIFWIILSVLLACTYNPKNEVMKKANHFMSNRLYLNSQGMKNFGITFMGQDIEWVGLSHVYEQTAQKKEYNYVDNSYLNILFQYGIVAFLIICLIFFQFTRLTIRKKDYYLLYILIILYFHSFLDPQLIYLSYNIFLLKLIDLLPSLKKRKEEEGNFQNSLTLEEIHEEQIHMFQDITKFLDQEQLHYYICGGTLLGAIRHQGFIPWDDDIDIIMPRPDYDKLQEIAKHKKIADYLEIHSFELRNLNDPMCKIYHLGTEMEKYYIDDLYDNHMWIDIFPMDGLPDDMKKVHKIFRKSLRYRRLLRLRKVREELLVKEAQSKFLAITKPFLKFVVDLFPTRFYVSKINRLCRKYSYEDSKYVGGIAWGYGPQERMLRSEVDKETLVSFEKMKVKTFSCWDTYLKNLYGDYMKLPPKEKRVSHVMKVRKI